MLSGELWELELLSRMCEEEGGQSLFSSSEALNDVGGVPSLLNALSVV
jgi:hypothetical protein